MGVFPLHCAHRRGTISGVPLPVVGNPPDPPEWVKETIRPLSGSSADGRRPLLHFVEEATDADLLAGAVDEGGPGAGAMSTETPQSSALDTFGTETRPFPRPAEFARQANVTDPAV